MQVCCFFCSSNYDVEHINQAMAEAFQCPVFGCTTSGEIGTKYFEHSIVGVGFSAHHFNLEVRLIKDLEQFNEGESIALKHSINEALTSTASCQKENRLGFVLIDGLSGKEEVTIANLYNGFEGMEIVGGSSGDSLAFEETSVFGEAQCASNAAVFVVIETDLPFRTFKYQHFEPTESDLVITGADTNSRVVHEINGLPAAEEYAEVLGLAVEELNSQVFAENPVMLEVGNQWYVRSIQKTNPDGSLSFYCAIDEGVPLTIAKGMDYKETLKNQFDELKAELGAISLTIGCDCILRRLELARLDAFAEVEEVLNDVNFVGFSSYGEQYNSIHVNQTLTGVAFGLS